MIARRWFLGAMLSALAACGGSQEPYAVETWTCGTPTTHGNINGMCGAILALPLGETVEVEYTIKADGTRLAAINVNGQDLAEASGEHFALSASINDLRGAQIAEVVLSMKAGAKVSSVTRTIRRWK